MGIFRDFWNRKAGKAQIICEAAWAVALALAIHVRNIEALTVLPILGAGIVILFVN